MITRVFPGVRATPKVRRRGSTAVRKIPRSVALRQDDIQRDIIIKVRGQSPHRVHNKYYVGEQVYSLRDSIPRHVPDVPHRLAAVPAFDQVPAAYQAARIDADGKDLATTATHRAFPSLNQDLSFCTGLSITPNLDTRRRDISIISVERITSGEKN